MFTRVSGGLHVFLKLHHPVVATSRLTNNSRACQQLLVSWFHYPSTRIRIRSCRP